MAKTSAKTSVKASVKRTGLQRIVRTARAHTMLLLAILTGIIVFVVLAASIRLASRLLIGWNVCAGLFLVVIYANIMRADVQRIRMRAQLEDEGRTALLILTGIAGVASLSAIIVELGTQNGVPRSSDQVALALITTALSWAFIHTVFALHYAHEFYGSRSARGGLKFPDGSAEPDYWDFVYFSFVIGMTSQVSDVGISSKTIRRTATAQGVLSFLYNVALVALTVNIAANALGGN
jgi:uncharacterized membrane protein